MHHRVMLFLAVLFVLSVLTLAAQSPPTDAGATKPLASRELDVEGVVAEVIESVRKGDILTVRVRFRNVGSAPARISLADGSMSYHVQNYIVAGDTRYEILRDTKGNALATPRDGGGSVQPTIRPKATYSWWANFPAPPTNQKTYTLFLKTGPPIDDVPIVDK